MNCKHCNAELAEDVTVCPVCGKEQEIETAETVEETAAAEQTPAEEVTEETPVEEEPVEEAPAEAAPAKASPRKITAAIIAIVLVAGILIGLVAGGFMGDGTTPATTPTETATGTEAAAVEIPADGDPSSPLCKASYTVSDEEAIAAADTVIATMGDKTLTNGELQAYYWQEIYMFLQENSSYAYYLGLDYYTPLDQQVMQMDVTMSWQQFFLDGAIATWKSYQALALEGEETGHEMPAERREDLVSMEKDMRDGAVLAGHADADAMIAANVGANCTLADYMHYATTYYEGMSYFQAFCESQDPSMEELEAFYAENEAYFTDSGVTKDAKFVNVRHTLLVPNNGEYSGVGENGYAIYPEEAWEACRVEAEEIYAKWQEGDMSEESFAELANTYTDDNNDTDYDGIPDGGLYEDVNKGRMVPAFDAWCFDESRQVGDHGLVKTEYGYHIIFYCGDRNWEYYTRNEMINDAANNKIPEVVEKFAAEVDFSKVALCNVPLA